MGAYVNPKKGEKEDWLRENGKQIPAIEAQNHKDFEENLLVTLLNNGPFTAAGICFDQRELNEFTKSSDTRPRMYFLVEKSKLLKVSNLKDYLK